MELYRLPSKSDQKNRIAYLILNYLGVPSVTTVEFFPEENAIPPF
jgi:hypothetical protein